MEDRYFTKSLFRLAIECPTKLFYARNAAYKNEMIEDPFLEALQDGGYQVGALAKEYISGGIDLSDLNNADAYERTKELLKLENVTIYEAVFRYQNIQIRSDILVKNSNDIEIVEVKSKSYDRETDRDFRDTKGKKILSKWIDTLLDVSIQEYVVKNQISPDTNLKCSLMLIDKSLSCPTDGLNQKFKVSRGKSKNSIRVTKHNIKTEDLEPWLLQKINVDAQICEIQKDKYQIDSIEMSFEIFVNHLANSYVNDEKIETELGAKCGKCEFNCSFNEEKTGLKSGFRECWKNKLKWQDVDFNELTVLDVWNFKSKDKLISQGKIKLDDLTEDDIHPEEIFKEGMTQKQRQWRQIKMYKAQDKAAFIDRDALIHLMSQWKFPYHFIDFETSTVAIPFHKNRKPYEAIAFQYSHHIVYENGKIEHKGEYINAIPGAFPNYDFLRALRDELSIDDGTIFRYHDHENSILNAIYRQLKSDTVKVDDFDELCAFIKKISKSTDNSADKWLGDRCMVDLGNIIEKYTFIPSTHGKSSMKVLLPAVLNISQKIQSIYSQPIYGSSEGIKSRNFRDWSVVVKIGEDVVNPYTRLPNVFDGIDCENIKMMQKAERIEEGGMALAAYGLMQFSEISDDQRNALRLALLRYCELDTLAMVLVYEYLYEKISF